MMAAGAVLCGGASSRFGTHKALVRIAGVTAVTRVSDAMRTAGLAPVIAVTGPGGPTAEELTGAHLDAVVDDALHRPAGERGPLCGLVAALEHVRAPVVLWPVDAPLVPPAVLRLLASGGAPVVTLKGEPLCARFSDELLPHLLVQLKQGRTGVRPALRTLAARTLRSGHLMSADPFSWHTCAFNTAEEHKELEVRLHGWAMREDAHAPDFLRLVRPRQQASQQRGPLPAR